MPAIRKCVDEGVLKFTGASAKFLIYVSDTDEHLVFMQNLRTFIALTSSMANAITALESQHITCADVFYTWVCVAVSLEQQFASTARFQKFRPTVIDIYNSRFDQMMTESSADIYLLAYFLHPKYFCHGGVQLVLPTRSKAGRLDKNLMPALLQRLTLAAVTILDGEQKRTDSGGLVEARQLADQITDWAYQVAPYSTAQWTASLRPLIFWENLARDDRCQALARVATKIFSIIPSEICDERTASRLGWFNSARRASILPENLVDSAALYDCYTFGYDEECTENLPPVFVKNPDVQAAAAGSEEVCQVRSAPTLMDLLNPDLGHEADAVAQEQAWFNHPDPYDLDEADRVVSHEPMVMRTSIRFAVTDFVSLDSPNLIALIKANGEVAPREAKQAQKVSADLGKPGEYNPRDLLDI